MKFLQSNVIRIKQFFTYIFWDKLKKDITFISYFPDKFRKYPPPKKYFWNVFSQIKQAEYEQLLQTEKEKIRNQLVNQNAFVRVSEEALHVFNDFVEDSMNLMCELISKEN